MNTLSLELTDDQFAHVARLVHDHCGIHLKRGKEALVRARLMKRLRALRMATFEAYFQFLDTAAGGTELHRLIDAMTTNKTSFFREVEHFRFLQTEVLPRLTGGRLRFWTAACSSGEEPYSLGMLLCEHLPDIDRRNVRILATDISQRMLERASRAVYPATALEGLPAGFAARYFRRRSTAEGGGVQVADAVRGLVHLACLNLMEAWPMRGPFDVIFCRNVMIYFDRPTQQRLIGRFYDLLRPGGYLFVGHSEGLSAIRHRFRYLQPATYVK